MPPFLFVNKKRNERLALSHICLRYIGICCRIEADNNHAGVEKELVRTNRKRKRCRRAFPWKGAVIGITLIYICCGASTISKRIEIVLFAAFTIMQVVAWLYLLAYLSAKNTKDTELIFFCERRVKCWFPLSFAILMLAAIGVNLGWLPPLC